MPGGSARGRAASASQDGDDEVPKQWLPPYAGPGAAVAGAAERAPSAGRAARAGGAARAGARVGPKAGGRALAQDVRISSKPDLRGLGQALARGGERGTLGCARTKDLWSGFRFSQGFGQPTFSWRVLC